MLYEIEMISDLEKELSDDFEKNLFSSALNNLKDKTNPLRLNNFSNAMRELTRHVLHRLAPDESILKCSWYKNEIDKPNGITRKQRSYYAVQGGLEDIFIEGTLGLEVDDIHKNLINSINKLSKFTHIEPKTFNLPEGDVDKLVKETISAVYEFLQLISECQRSIIEALWKHIDTAIIEETLRETIQSLDELATHHYIDEVYIDKVVIYSINHEHIQFSAIGTIGCELQWGSNSDLRRGDGVIIPKSFPFSCKLISLVTQPNSIDIVEGTLVVETSSWYG